MSHAGTCVLPSSVCLFICLCFLLPLPLQIFHGSVLDVSPATMTLEVTGKEDKMQALQDVLEPYGEEAWEGRAGSRRFVRCSAAATLSCLTLGCPLSSNQSKGLSSQGGCHVVSELRWRALPALLQASWRWRGRGAWPLHARAAWTRSSWGAWLAPELCSEQQSIK